MVCQRSSRMHLQDSSIEAGSTDINCYGGGGWVDSCVAHGITLPTHHVVTAQKKYIYTLCDRAAAAAPQQGHGCFLDFVLVLCSVHMRICTCCAKVAAYVMARPSVCTHFLSNMTSTLLTLSSGLSTSNRSVKSGPRSVPIRCDTPGLLPYIMRNPAMHSLLAS